MSRSEDIGYVAGRPIDDQNDDGGTIFAPFRLTPDVLAIPEIGIAQNHARLWLRRHVHGRCASATGARRCGGFRVFFIVVIVLRWRSGRADLPHFLVGQFGGRLDLLIGPPEFVEGVG